MEYVEIDTECSEYVPQLTEEIVISQFDQKSYYVYIPIYDYRIRINRPTKLLLDMIDGKRNLMDISEGLKKVYSLNFTPRDIYMILINSVGKFGILKDESVTVAPKKESTSYIKLKVILFRKSLVNLLCQPFTFFFRPTFFYSSLVLMLLVASILYFTKFSFHLIDSSISKSFLELLPAVGLFSLVLHELGHAAACKKHGAQPGAIGFGFYLIFPVFFADVSDSWRLKKSYRLIVDLAGFYMQVFLNFNFLILYLITGNPIFFAFGTMYIVSIFFNILPFVRRDGYWALSDITGIPNLKKKSEQALVNVLKSPSLLKKIKNYKAWVLFGYGLFNMCFMILFVFSVLYYNPGSIANYPLNLMSLIQSVFYGDLAFDELKRGVYRLMLPTIFYIMVFRFIVSKISSKLTTK